MSLAEDKKQLKLSFQNDMMMDILSAVESCGSNEICASAKEISQIHPVFEQFHLKIVVTFIKIYNNLFNIH
jgi:hypothetical protein